MKFKNTPTAMAKLSWTTPADSIGERDVSRGLRALLYEGVCSQIMDTFTGGAILVAFALLLGASNTMVGLLAAISPLTQVLQIPTVYFVDRAMSRKAIVVVSSFLSRIFWLVVAIIPWLVAVEQRLPVLLICLFLYFSLGSISACGFNPWIRDFVPEKIMGRYFGKCMAAATAAGAAVTVVTAVSLGMAKWYTPNQFIPYSVLFVLGGGIGLAGVYLLQKVPEPRKTASTAQSVFDTLGPPFRDFNFRRLLTFLGTWFFAINLAGPFYAVYMIKQLHVPMALVVSLSALSQVASVLSFRTWGRAADRFSNKSVLFVTGRMYIGCILLWPFLAFSNRYSLVIPLLVIIHVLSGISTAGLSLCTGNIALRAAPQGKATAFLAVNTLVHGIAAASAPIVGGIIADRLTGNQSSITLHLSIANTASLPDLSSFGLHGLHFIFFFTAILGLYALHRLRVVHEEGEVNGQVVIAYFTAEAAKVINRASSKLRLINVANSHSPTSLVRNNLAGRFLDRTRLLLFGNGLREVPAKGQNLKAPAAADSLATTETALCDKARNRLLRKVSMFHTSLCRRTRRGFPEEIPMFRHIRSPKPSSKPPSHLDRHAPMVDHFCISCVESFDIGRGGNCT
ncbi:MAG: MFS transporter [Desulfomonilaceae bacterium]